MFLEHTYIPNSNEPHETTPAIEIERFEISDRGLLSPKKGFDIFLDFLGRVFELEILDVNRTPNGKIATFILFEDVKLRLEGGQLLILCETTKVRDRILAQLLENRSAWVRKLGPLRYALRTDCWINRHQSQLLWALFLNAIVLVLIVCYLNGVYIDEDGTREGAIIYIGFFSLCALWFNLILSPMLWTWYHCRSGSLVIPEYLELTDRKLAGAFSENTWTTQIADINLEEIEKLWFMTEKTVYEVGRGRIQGKIRWKYRYDPFWLVNRDSITGLRIQAAGKKYTLWLDRFADDWAIEKLSEAIQQNVRERLFPRAREKQPSATNNASNRLEVKLNRQERDWEINISDNADWDLFNQVASVLHNEFGGQWTTQADGIDQRYWDLAVDSALVTLHLEHYTGIVLYSARDALDTDASNKLVERMANYLSSINWMWTKP
jgi:hypothetical protein